MSASPSSRSKKPPASSPGWTALLSCRPALLALLGLLILFVVLDRSAWASVAAWREDSATNIWLGYTRSVFEMPVGLISSMRIPNPNGLVLAAFILSRLPSLWAIGAVLGVIQAGLLAWVSWLGTRDLRLALLAAGPMLASITLRGASVELWGVWAIVPVNFLYFAGVLIYVRTRSLWALPLVVLSILAGPSMYFLGLVNSIAFSFLAIAVALRWKPTAAPRAWALPLLVTVAIVALSIWLVWAPYFREVALSTLSRGGAPWPRAPLQRLLSVAWALVGFPAYSLEQFAGPRLLAMGQVEPHLLSPTAWTGYQWLLRHAWIQALVCYASVLGAAALVVRRRTSLRGLVRPEHRLPALMVTLFVLIVAACYMLAPALGGPAWAEGQRLDQVTQYLPFMLVFWFMTPVLLSPPGRLMTALRRLTWISAVVYTVCSMGLGLLIVVENLRYRGRKLTDADVPVYDKLRLVAFVARDWREHSSSPEIPIDYDLGGGRWEWITQFGSSYLDWYPAPYTIGRAFDYELLRGYGLHNAQEGVQERTFGSGRYLINYAFRPAPELPGEVTRDYEFGRLRLTIREASLSP